MSPRTLRDTFNLDLREATQNGRMVRGVSVLGKVSKNGRTYRRSAQEDVVEHVRKGRDTVYADHPRDGEPGVRPTASMVGVLENVRLSGDTVKADLRVADSPPWNTLVPWIAREAPTAAGLSIRARGTVREGQDGAQVVTSIAALEGVELVTEPAATSALVESVQRSRREEIVEVLEDGGVEPDRFGVFIRWAAGRPDGAEQARAFVEEFDRAVDPRQHRDRGGGGPAAVSPERDPDAELRESRRDGEDHTPVTSDTVEEAADRLFN